MNRQVTGYIYSKVDGAREYFALKEMNEQLVQENTEMRNRLDLISSSLDSATVVSDVKGDYRYYFVQSRIVRNSISKQLNYLTLNKGKEAGSIQRYGCDF